MQSTGANRASSPNPGPHSGTETKPPAAAPGPAAGAAPPEPEKRPRPQPIWPGPYKKERSRANPFTIMLSIAALLLALGGLYWISSMQDDLARQRDSILTLEQQNRKLADQSEETATDARAASEALMEQQGLKQSGQTTPKPIRQPAAPKAQSSAKAAYAPARPSPPAPQPKKQTPSAAPSTGYEPVVHIYPTAAYPARTGSSAVAASSLHKQPAPASPPPRVGLQAHAASPSFASAQPSAGRVANSGVRTGLFGNPALVATRNLPSTSATVAGPAPAKREYPIPIAHPAAGPSSSPLAENIERVATLQRHTSVPLQEFHVAEGSLTKPFPDTGIEARKLDAKHGTFRLIVVGSDSSSEQKGTVFEPLPVVDQTTGRHYRLTITNIQNNQLYGYLTEAR
ncbi:MAG: hypothetical protein ACR2JE_07480 [Acidobacteriaceae bacterium]